jgi:hypothetical protein
VGADRRLIERYERLADLAEQETAAARDGDLVRLGRLHGVREEIVAGLPAQAPEEARAPLERALDAQHLTMHALEAGMAEVRSGLSRLVRGHAAARAYVQVSASASEYTAWPREGRPESKEDATQSPPTP